MSDGIPSPSPNFPQKIHNVSGDNNVKIQNKNLFDDELLSQTENYNTFDTTTQKWTTNSGGSYYRSFFYNVTGNSTQRDITKLLKLKANTTYTLKLFDLVGNNISVSLNLGFFGQEGNCINHVDFTTDTKTFTTENECYLDIRRKGSTGSYSFSGIQLELGTTATTYVEHEEQNLPFTFAEGQKAMQGTTLQDDGIHQKRKQVVFDGSSDENWVINASSSSRTVFQISINDIESYTNRYAVPNLMSSHFISVSNDSSWKVGDISRRLNTSDIIVCMQPNMTIEDLRTWLSNNNVTVEYVLAEEEIIPYSTTQQAQYNAIKQAKSYNDQTNISQTNDDLPFILDITALKNI